MSNLTTVMATVFTLTRNAFGKLELIDAKGERFVGVMPVRAFPIQSPDDGISMVSTDGHEVAWIDQLFMPVISDIVSITSFSTPCTWSVVTDRGNTEFVLRGEEDIRRIGKEGSLLISDVHGIQYLVKDQYALNAHSKKILDRFL